MLQSFPVLQAPDFEKQFKLVIDAMIWELVLCCNKKIVKVLTIQSVSTPRNKKKYSAIEKEALALLLALHHFDVYLHASQC